MVTILLHPNQHTVSNYKKVITKRDEEELEEFTFQPNIMVKKNDKILNQDKFQTLTGDHNLDLYVKSREHEKRNREADEYWYEKEKEECKFRPEINKHNFQEVSQSSSINEIKGLDKQL